MVNFIEKPDFELAKRIIYQGNSACNTGINVWMAKNVLRAFKGKSVKGLTTDFMMEKLYPIKVAIGNFKWYDCGTLLSLYEISPKTPDFEIAMLGGGDFERFDCSRSLLYADEGMELRVIGAQDDAVVFTTINEKPILVVSSLEESRKIKLLAEDYFAHEAILADDFSLDARNNTVLRSNVSRDLIVGFVGVDNYAVYVYRKIDDGKLVAVVSQQVR